METLQNQHRKEQKDLQARITQKKKNATKKTRKRINDECEKLQQELELRHKAEIDALGGNIENGIAALQMEEGEAMREDSFQPKDPVTSSTTVGNSVEALSHPTQQSRKPNRHKARLARRAADQEAQAAQAAKEAAMLPDLRKQEMASMKEHYEKLGFKEISIRPDGHCMYSAVGMLLQDLISERLQFETNGLQPYQAIRAEAAHFISQHPADFEGFLEEPIGQYTHKIQNTSEWGGQLELQAIARAYGVDINVLQADGRIEKIDSGGEAKVDAIWLTYYRHSFGLGQHYNALQKEV